MLWRGGGGGGENQPALSEVNPPADATALSFSPPPTSPAESGSFPACLPPAYSGTSRMIPDPLAHSHCLPLCFICSWNPWLPTSSLQVARPFGEQPYSTWLPPRPGLAAVYLHLSTSGASGKPGFCLPNLPWLAFGHVATVPGGLPASAQSPREPALSYSLGANSRLSSTRPPAALFSKAHPAHHRVLPSLPFTSDFCPDSLDLTILLRASGILVPASLMVLL